MHPDVQLQHPLKTCYKTVRLSLHVCGLVSLSERTEESWTLYTHPQFNYAGPSVRKVSAQCPPEHACPSFESVRHMSTRTYVHVRPGPSKVSGTGGIEATAAQFNTLTMSFKVYIGGLPTGVGCRRPARIVPARRQLRLGTTCGAACRSGCNDSMPASCSRGWTPWHSLSLQRCRVTAARRRTAWTLWPMRWLHTLTRRWNVASCAIDRRSCGYISVSRARGLVPGT